MARPLAHTVRDVQCRIAIAAKEFVALRAVLEAADRDPRVAAACFLLLIGWAASTIQSGSTRSAISSGVILVDPGDVVDTKHLAAAPEELGVGCA